MTGSLATQQGVYLGAGDASGGLAAGRLVGIDQDFGPRQSDRAAAVVHLAPHRVQLAVVDCPVDGRPGYPEQPGRLCDCYPVSLSRLTHNSIIPQTGQVARFGHARHVGAHVIQCGQVRQ